MKPGRILLLLAVAMLFVVIYLNKCSSNKSGNNSKATGSKSSSPLAVSGVIVNTQTLSDQIYASGTLLSNNEVELRNEIPGKLMKLGFEEGSRVTKGDLLVKIDDSDLQAQLRKLLLDKELAEKDESRQRDLLNLNGISQQEYDIALTGLNKLKADIELLRTQIAKTEIRSPFNGKIGLRTVSEGSFLPTNTRIATLQEDDPMKLEFSIPEKYVGSMGTHSEVSFSVESAKGKFKGKVYASEPKIDVLTRTLTLRAICPNPQHQLIPGAFAKIDVPLEKIDGAIMIPTQCVIPELKGYKVFTVHEGKARTVKINLGFRNDSTVQVTEGLSTGDTVLTTGIMQMRPEMPVKVSVR